MVEQLPPTSSHPAFCNAMLPRRLNARPLGLQTRGVQKGDHVGIELCIPIQNDVTLRAGFGKGLPQLLDDPLRSRVVASH